MLDATTVGSLFLDALLHFALVAAPILAASVISAVIINVVQVGFLFSTKAAAPKFDKINPIKGFKRIFSVRSLVELLKNILKIVIVGWLAYGEYQAQLGNMPNMMGAGRRNRRADHGGPFDRPGLQAGHRATDIRSI